MNTGKNKNSKDIFYIMALSLVVIGGCATPLGKFNKKEAVVEKEKEPTQDEQLNLAMNEAEGVNLQIFRLMEIKKVAENI